MNRGRSGGRGTSGGEAVLVDALRAGDEQAFSGLVDRYYDTMLRVARVHVATHEAAEDVVQEALLAVVAGIDQFEARSSFVTWMFRILVNRAKTRGQLDRRSQPFSSLDAELSTEEASVDPARFQASGRWRGFWADPPTTRDLPEDGVLTDEVRGRLAVAIEDLPPTQRLVLTLRDVHGFPAQEVRDLLQLTDANQRVLLHRARSKVRSSLETYLRDEGER